MNETRVSLEICDVILHSIEIVVNLLLLPLVCLLGYICVVQKNLHLNFRIILQTLNISSCFYIFQRILSITATLTYSHDRISQLLENSYAFLIFGSFLNLFSWLGLAVERVVAFVVCCKYERLCGGYGIYYIFLLPSISLSAILVYLSESDIILDSLANKVIVAVQAILAAAIAVLFPIILRYNKLAFSERHRCNLDMTTRYQLDENIRAARYILPVVFITVVYRVLFTVLLIYNFFISSTLLGKDEGVLGHFYDLISGINRLLTTGWLVFASDRFGLACFKRLQKIGVNSYEQDSEGYFRNLSRYWE